MEKYGLVLEGGGVRGAYTAGALAWLNDQGIVFDYSAGISSGAVYLACYELANKESARNMCLYYATDKENVGVRAFLREGHYVAYEHLINDYLIKKEHLDVEKLRDQKVNMEIGLYDLEKGETVWFGSEYLENKLRLLRAACALPIASAPVEFHGKLYLDGGVTKMIPIERSVEQGCTKHLVITTKPADFVRKPGSPAVKIMMRMFYHDYPKLREDYNVRHLNYYKQMDLIEKLIQEGNAIMIRPTKTVNVSRYKGDSKDLAELYDLGYQDMEDRKEEIFRFMGKNND
ncbi:MAG: patatin family protein [Solobacterium sp.]|nr:patatin family protein [Solobacterium sp.]